jgi:hypothetical protein
MGAGVPLLSAGEVRQIRFLQMIRSAAAIACVLGSAASVAAIRDSS